MKKIAADRNYRLMKRGSPRSASRAKTFEEIKKVLIQNDYRIQLFGSDAITARKGAEFTEEGEEIIKITTEFIKRDYETYRSGHGPEPRSAP